MINSINVLFITQSPDTAGQVIGCIRFRGRAVRPKQAGNRRDLERLLQSYRFDVVLLVDNDLDLALEDVTRALQQSGRQTPIIVLTDRPEAQRLEDIDAGAFSAVGSQCHDMAAAMTLKAVDHLQRTRELHHLRTLLREADRRYLLMLDASRYPIACFHRGAAIYANEAWRERFEISLTESLDAIALQDLVVPEQREILNQLLDAREGEPEALETCETLAMRTRRGHSFEADIVLTGTIIDGNPCIVVHLGTADAGAVLEPPPGAQRIHSQARPPPPEIGVDTGEDPLETVPILARRASPVNEPDPEASPVPTPTQTSTPERQPASVQETPPPADRTPEAAPDSPYPAREETLAETLDEQASAFPWPADAGTGTGAASTVEPKPPRHAELIGHDRFLRILEERMVAASRSEQPLAVAVLLPDGDGQAATGTDADTIAERLAELFPPPATLAKLDAGEYAILVPETRRPALESRLDALMGADSEGTFDLDTVALSCGVALADDSGPEASQLLQRARQALAESRDAGGGRYRFHVPAAARETRPEADAIWKSRIHDAMGNDRLRLLFQPIVSLHGTQIPRYSVFVRLKGPGGETYEPADFMPAAERTGVAAPLDRWIIRHALATLASHLQRDSRIAFFVKLSQGSLDGEPVVEWLRRFLDRYRVPAGNVVVEFKEATVLTQLEMAMATARGLRELGVGLCLGDFGNGLDPFRILQRIDAGFIKLDGAYVQNLAENDASQNTVRDFTETAHADGRQVIVPFVEDAATLTVLFGLGANLVQGHFVQPPSEDLDFDFVQGF
ncbi:EAL domain-containing protein [Thioalkalivibrio paradoxus]|nr:EAL domain-containing protein [Thioalkalivibrio paradoxus]